MNGAFDLRIGESHIEVHNFRTGAIVLSALFALVIQAWFPLHFTRAALLDLPLLVTIYFGLSRRNPSTGLLLGTVIGLMQDSLTPTVPLGLYGIAKTIIGYLASSIGARLDTEHPAARYALTAGFFILHQAVVALTRRILLGQPESWFSLHLFGAALLNGLIAVLLFLLLDRLRRPS
ncbi:MAG TPA: rod shape-determining protein MreD [Candidatus Acidoferrum sp.]|nr:rod shape-determining protein MreD [Candidatus Acidoferrum sp.]